MQLEESFIIRTTITRRFAFDYAHRILNHESKCRHLHGHRGVFELTVTSPQLDSLGRVIDFSVIKHIVGKWIDENLDHNTILHKDDRLAWLWQTAAEDVRNDIFAGKAPYTMVDNPTAENLARHLFYNCRKLLPENITVVRARFYETENCFADYME